MIAIPPDLERIQITERIQAGIAAAKARGVQVGRKKNVGTIRPSRSAKASNREKPFGRCGEFQYWPKHTSSGACQSKGCPWARL